jgi:hypothetical protein
MEILLDKIETFYNLQKGSGGIKMAVLLLYALVIYALYKIFVVCRIPIVLGMFSTILIYLLAAEYALRTNVQFAKKQSSVGDALRSAKHGDFVFFRSYENYDLPELLFYRHLNALTSKTFFGHIGIVLELNGKKYIFESTEDEYFSTLTRTVKNGVLLQDFAKRVKEYHGRVHIQPTNLGTFMQDTTRIWNFIQHMKHELFVTWRGGISCLFIVRNLLNEFKLLKNPKAFPLRPEFFLTTKHYTVPVKVGEPYLILNDYVA